MARRERRKPDAPADKERIGGNEEGVSSLAHHGGEGRIDLAAKQSFIDWPTDASGMRRQLSPAADTASDRP
jgi:hypothetical protein